MAEGGIYTHAAGEPDVATTRAAEQLGRFTRVGRATLHVGAADAQAAHASPWWKVTLLPGAAVPQDLIEADAVPRLAPGPRLAAAGCAGGPGVAQRPKIRRMTCANAAVLQALQTAVQAMHASRPKHLDGRLAPGRWPGMGFGRAVSRYMFFVLTRCHSRVPMQAGLDRWGAIVRWRLPVQPGEALHSSRHPCVLPHAPPAQPPLWAPYWRIGH